MIISKPTVYPTFVLGLGGTGTNVVRHVKRRFLDEVGPDSNGELPSLFQVLAVDTEPLVNRAGVQSLYFHEFAFLGRFDATKLVQNRKEHRPYLDWWTWGDNELNLGYIHNGAKQLRPVGRLCFVRNYDTFRSAVQSKLRNVQKARAIAAVEEKEYPVQTNMKLVYIVSSICGGTGAGMLIDAARCVRDYIGEEAKVIGVLAMPSVFVEEIQSEIQKRRIYANAYAVLKELNYFQTNTQEFKQLYPNEDHEIPGTAIKPFDQVFLVEMTDNNGTALSDKDSVERMIAHFIQLTNLSDVSNEILGRDANIHEMAYSAFGVSAIVYPREQMDRLLRLRILENSIDDVLREGSQAKIDFDERIRGLIRDFANGKRLTDKQIRDLGSDFSGNGPKWKELRDRLIVLISGAVQTYGYKTVQTTIQAYASSLKNEWESAESAKNAEGRFQLMRWGILRPPEVVTPILPVDWYQRLFLPKVYSDRVDAQLQLARYKLMQNEFSKLVPVLSDMLLGLANRLGKLTEVAAKVKKDSQAEFQALAADISPFDKSGELKSNNGSRFYELEMPAVAKPELDAIHRWLSDSIKLEKKMPSAENDTDRDAVLMRPYRQVVQEKQSLALVKWLAHISTDAEITVAGIREKMACPEFDEWIVAAAINMDIRHVYAGKKSNNTENEVRPNNRANQLHTRSALHADIDREIHNFASATPEPLRIVTAYMPQTIPDGEKALDAALKATLREHGDFKAIGSGNRDRMDSVYILHGIPGSHIRGLETLYHAYWGDDAVLQHKHLVGAFDARRFHLNRSWAALMPELFPDSLDSRAMNRKDEYAREEAQRAAATAAAAAPAPDARGTGRRGSAA